jgi:N-acetylmuramoyl-L-alanine amidase
MFVVRIDRRQVMAIGLALFFVGVVMAGEAWTSRRAVQGSAELAEAGRYLRGRVVAVDPGHGGHDPGAVVGSTLEKDLVLAISLKLQAVLEQQGATVVMTRTRDVSLGGAIRTDLGRRVNLAKEQGANVYVSIHANKDSCRCWGAQTFYQKDGKPAGRELATAIQGQLRRLTPTTRSALAADYYVLREFPAPAAMVEVGFLTDPRERARLLDPGYQQTVVTAVALGLADFFRAQVPEAAAQGSIGR